VLLKELVKVGPWRVVPFRYDVKGLLPDPWSQTRRQFKTEAGTRWRLGIGCGFEAKDEQRRRE